MAEQIRGNQSIERDLTDKEKMEFVFHVQEDVPEVEVWNQAVATELAKQEGIEFTDDCWNVVSFLRKYFEDVGSIDYARDLSVMLNQRFQEKGGLKFLFTIFPKGPVSQGCKIAGIPVPKDSKDNSFGTVA